MRNQRGSTLLIVENDRPLAEALADIGRRLGCVTMIAPTLAIAYQELEEAVYELVLIDRLLDDGDGLELVAYAHDVSPSTKLLVMSQRGDVADRIRGLAAGADDYLAKPLELRECMWKIKKYLQFEKLFHPDQLTIAGWTLDRQAGELRSAQKVYALTPKEVAIMSLFFRHKNQVVSREMIIDRVWPAAAETPLAATIDVYIRRLRQKLDHQRSLLKTIRGFGYMVHDRGEEYAAKT